MDDLEGHGRRELQQFLGQWREELSETSSLGKRYNHSLEIFSDEIFPTKRPHTANKTNDPLPLLVLPAGKRNTPLYAHPQSKRDDCSKTDEGKKLVDTLIADLNEINTIPFFDVDLPREIAIVIFGYLDMRDLCSCAVVSRSWNILAGDNLLWYNHYYRLVPSTQCDVPPDCKSAVQDLVLRRRQMKMNWKERVCGLSEHQPDDARVLCCLSYSEGHVFSCYSSGAVYVWNVSDDRGPMLVKQTPSPYLTSEPSCCATVDSSWGVLGTRDGCVKIVDMETCSQVYCLSDLGSVNSVSVSRSERRLVVGVASFHDSVMVQPNLSVLVAEGGREWERTGLKLGEIKSQITKVKVLSSDHLPCSLLYSTSTSLTLHPLLHSTKPTHILSSLGERGRATCVGCFESDRDMSVVACGTSAFGYQVQLFDLPTGASILSLKGHGQQVTSLSFFSSSSTTSPHMIVSGSADRRVRVFDCRCHTPFPVHTLKGHGGTVHHVQMDNWKIMSGSSDGMLAIWDQRMALEMWRSQERHPIGYCAFDSRFLVCGHVPQNKHPIRDIVAENPNICHRRLRGVVRVMDFAIDPLYYTRKLPSVFSSNYDEPVASSFNLDLKLPYDDN